MSPSSMVQNGPARTRVRSTTFSPSNGGINQRLKFQVQVLSVGCVLSSSKFQAPAARAVRIRVSMLQLPTKPLRLATCALRLQPFHRRLWSSDLPCHTPFVYWLHVGHW